MAAIDPSLQVCPTRIDGSQVLFAHKVEKKRCQERQRKRYHKCFTCAWNNNWVAANGPPPKVVERPVKLEPDLEPELELELEPPTANVG